MLSKSQIKLIKSLTQKKFRNTHELFVVEGIKGIGEFLNSEIELVTLYTTGESFEVDPEKVVEIDEKELKKISSLKTPQKALAIFEIPANKEVKLNDLVVALDGIRDPGNLGTIIRLCDWFGVEELICSSDTVDCFNPKVIQATMGSLARVNVTYLDLEDFLTRHNSSSIMGTMLEGENVYLSELPQKGIVIFGNEANGISPEIGKFLHQRIHIPQFGKIKKTESLNVATATSIILSEIRRSSFTEKQN
ncbi:RNA methyltransferase [Gramella lutea]|uniref:RNA methyltransferase n=1 Tax=Christiangramia lutea TaxID=1607951 RepID=A0A9X2AA56_9FLAO|nr:RNA methyltransferase [Christiangramia lutea]MCH4821728.1 RNA methyltransferase [Christiangramia lutea]